MWCGCCSVPDACVGRLAAVSTMDVLQYLTSEDGMRMREAAGGDHGQWWTQVVLLVLARCAEDTASTLGPSDSSAASPCIVELWDVMLQPRLLDGGATTLALCTVALSALAQWCLTVGAPTHWLHAHVGPAALRALEHEGSDGALQFPAACAVLTVALPHVLASSCGDGAGVPFATASLDACLRLLSADTATHQHAVAQELLPPLLEGVRVPRPEWGGEVWAHTARDRVTAWLEVAIQPASPVRSVAFSIFCQFFGHLTHLHRSQLLW